MSASLPRLKAARTAAAIVAVAALIGLAGLALAANAGGGVLGVAQPVLASPSTTTPPTTVPPRPVVAVTPPAVATGSPRPLAAPATTATTATTVVPATTATTLTPPPPVPPPVDAEPRPCALGLPTPEHTGGVSSLIGIVPLFGPFTAEAFALQPAWGPFLDDIGPLVALGAAGLDAAQPLLDALTPALQALEQAGFDTLAPLYLPVRQDLLDAQADLAAALAPITEAISTAPGTECLIALQGLLVDPLLAGT